jgi:hypothetical protein
MALIERIAAEIGDKILNPPELYPQHLLWQHSNFLNPD